jgi:23S rRNA (adenine2030-N6)-methyltransferase
MLSYQHAYHAGGRADLHKHRALVALLLHLIGKDRPLSYLESHAGRGLYDLASPEAWQTGEAEAGIRQYLASPSAAEDPYRRLIEAVRTAHGPDAYPGSPLIARTLLRPADRLHLIELHPAEYRALRRQLGGPNVHLHRRDGFEGVLALAPPSPRRGMALIDPSYEVKSDYETTAEVALKLRRKWPEGVLLIWYPILEAGGHERLRRGLEGEGAMLADEARWPALKSGHGLVGSGLVCLNAPYGFGWPERL